MRLWQTSPCHGRTARIAVQPAPTGFPEIAVEMRPPHTPWLSPWLAVQDADRAVAFYEKAFGLELRSCYDDVGVMQHAELGYRGELLFMLAPEGTCGLDQAPASGGFTAPQRFYVYVDDVDAFHARAMAAGAKCITAPEDAFWGDRICVLEDPDGYRWCFARFVERPEGH